MTVPQVAESFARQQRTVATATATAIAARWRRIDPDDIIGSWSELLPGATAAVVTSQLEAARNGATYTAAAVREQGLTPQPPSQVRVRELAGIASDGRPLDTLLALPAAQTLGALARGVDPEIALDQSRRRIMMFAATQVLDAGRIAASIGLVTDKRIFGYLRQLRGATSCARCVIQAGKWFGWNAGFLRHPRCDCVHVPYTGSKADAAGLEGFDPQAHFASLDQAQQDRVFTKAGAEAIRDGADMGQIVNARRGMRTAYDPRYGRTVSTTLEGMTKRGAASKTMRRMGARFDRPVIGAHGETRRIAARPVPEEIYRAADGDRDLAIRALARFGYLA